MFTDINIYIYITQIYNNIEPGPASAFVGCCGPSWAFFPSLWACVELRWLLWISCKFKKNTLLKKTDLLAVFHLCGPASAFVGCCGPSWAFVDKVYIKKILPIPAQTTRLSSFGPFVPLRGPASAFVGCCGPSWAFFLSSWACVNKLKITKTIHYKKKHTYCRCVL